MPNGTQSGARVMKETEERRKRQAAAAEPGHAADHPTFAAAETKHLDHRSGAERHPDGASPAEPDEAILFATRQGCRAPAKAPAQGTMRHLFEVTRAIDRTSGFTPN